METSFKYWLKQLTFISAEDTLALLTQALVEKKPAAYLRFGQADIDAALANPRAGPALPPAFTQEVRQTLLLCGPQIYKSLQVECPALYPGAAHVSNKTALARLNAVGACFLEDPLYSHSALQTPAAPLSQFYAALAACQPILLTTHAMAGSEILPKINPSHTILLDEEPLYQNLDQLEAQTLARCTAAHFPVVVLALGLTGRLLAGRLIRRAFPAFLLDFDSLPASPPPAVRKPWLPGFPPTARRPHPAALPAGEPGLPIRWQGPFLGHYSYAVINRELCSRLAQNQRLELTIQPSDTPFTNDNLIPTQSTGFDTIVEHVGRPLSRPAEIHISNHPQHPYLAPQHGRWVIIQPWDYMSLPVRWLDWINTQIDQVWVPSHFVRAAFLEAGLPPARIAVVPNGVDTHRCHPNARKVNLPTRKSFKFLFVGGPFWRKGFDILLEAYRKAFTARDDVCLVIKSAPEFWTTAGTQRLAEFRARTAAPEIISIIQPLDQQRMAGLYASCDCLVHPYRAEGFAMCVAEGMASGLPVIVTGAGATADFCNPQTAFLLPSMLRHLPEKHIDNLPTLDYPGYLEPDLEALITCMRRIYTHPESASLIAQAGLRKIQTQFTWDHAAQTAAQQLTTLMR
jgi:glycosyltransferase involved in cell wall biosynthesis